MWLKYFFAHLLLFFFIQGSAQRLYNTPFAISPKELANNLIAGATTDEQKVYGIFRWITDNVDYRMKPVGLKANLQDTSTVLRPLDEIVAEHVLVHKVAVCDGYARLFKTLCNYAGIKCEIINGYAKNSTDRTGKRFRTNHTWNAVLIDSAWRLLDVTWASGYVSLRGDYFIRQYEPKYFLTPPEEFIKDHYPEDVAWSLLPLMPTLEEFKYAPFRSQAFVRGKVKSFFPASGTIDAQKGDTINFLIEAEDTKKSLILADGSGAFYLFAPQKRSGADKLFLNSLTYIVGENKDMWLDVKLEDDVLLRYKLVAKKESQ